VLQILLDWSLRATPLLIETGIEGVHFPSAALTLATVVLGYFAVMVAREIKRRKRKWPYVIIGLLLSLLVLARIYLGLDWFSGALLGVALGMAWTFVVGIAYRQRAVRAFNGMAASLIFFGMLAATFAWQVNENLEMDIAALKLPLPKVEINASDWWQNDWRMLPPERAFSSSVGARELNFQFAGDPATLARVLARHGWQEAQSANWRWVLLSMNPEANENTLQPLKRDYLGHEDVLLLHRLGGDPNQQETLRIWDSGFRLKPGGRTLYVGEINSEELVQRLNVFSYWRALPPLKGSLEQLQAELDGLQTRRVGKGPLLIREPQDSAAS